MPPVVGPLNGYAVFDRQHSPTQQKVQAALDANPEKAEIFRARLGTQEGRRGRTPSLFHTYLDPRGAGALGRQSRSSNETTIYFVDDDITAGEQQG